VFALAGNRPNLERISQAPAKGHFYRKYWTSLTAQVSTSSMYVN